jgi:hypothetical protein
MNDDELPMRAETASAYLDGELDAAAREAAAADRETMALVDSFAQVRAALGDVGPIDDDTRSSAIAAALGEFDARSSAAPAAAAAAAAVVPLHKHRIRGYWLVTGVAAAVLIGVVAVAALNSTGDDNNLSSANQAVVPFGEPTAESPESPGTPALKVGDSAADGAAVESAPTPAAAGTAGAGAAADSSSTVVPDVDNAAELTQYATSVDGTVNATDAAPAATEAPAATTTTGATAVPAVAPAPASATAHQPPTCLPSNETVLGEITVKGVPAFAVLDAATGTVRAVDAANCHVYFSVPAP